MNSQQMKRKVMMSDFAYGRCEAVKESKKFLDDWFKTRGNPCSICCNDKSKCNYYKKMVESGVIDEEENPP